MGDGLQERLSTSQLQRVVEIVRLNRDRVGNMSVGDVIAALNQNGDPAIVAAVLRTGFSCTI